MTLKEGHSNALAIKDRAVHDWYRFVLSFPPHLVQTYLARFNVTSDDRVLDPFCGTGTTLVECKKQGISSVGIEANALTYFASSTKIDWTIEPEELLKHAQSIAVKVRNVLEAQGINDDGNLVAPALTTPLLTLTDNEWKIMLKDSISPLPLHKTLNLIKNLNLHSGSSYFNHETLALAKSVVNPISNLRFGPEASIGYIKDDTPTLMPWLTNIRAMVADLRDFGYLADVPSIVHHADARKVEEILEPNSVDIVITSPPYPNEKDYTRMTRLESVLLGFIQDRSELRSMKQNLIRSNTRNVYVTDEDDNWVAEFEEIQQIAEEIENKRIQLGKTSGFEKLYGRVTKLYFGGMLRHLSGLREVLRPGARLAYVVGDQASYLQIMIRTGQLLAEIAESLGYEVISIDLFRTRNATATRAQLREEVVVLRWNG